MIRNPSECDPTTEQILAMRAVLGPNCHASDVELRRCVLHASSEAWVAGYIARKPSKAEIETARTETAMAFSALRDALALPGNALGHQARAALEEQLAAMHASLEQHRDGTRAREVFAAAYGQRPADRRASKAVQAIAEAYQRMTGLRATVSIDPVTRHVGGTFADLVHMVCGFIGLEVTGNQIDKALRAMPKGLIAGVPTKKEKSGGMTKRRAVSNQTATLTNEVADDLDGRHNRRTHRTGRR